MSGSGSQPGHRPREIDDIFVGKSWDSLRQGARNVAGVRFQIAVTALLLVESRGGGRRFVELVPEGYEDIDAIDSAGAAWYVQVKEVGAGAGTFNVSRLADVITHASAVAGPTARIVAITDGIPGSGLIETGWDRSLEDTEGMDLGRLRAALADRGHSLTDVSDLFRRTHFVRVPWNASVPAVDSLAKTFSIPRALASLVFSALIDDLSAVAADQRGTTEENAGHLRVGDLDELVGRVLELVDRQKLDSAVQGGICGPAEFNSEPAIALGEFLLGVDAHPAHISAGFDVIRPTPALAVQKVLSESRYALLAGPSGAGKSTQMWRSARDAARGARVVRVHRISDDGDVQELIRHVRLLLPTPGSPVVVACDDLGRPHTAAWPSAVRRLLEIRSVQLLGAVRNEDLTPELLRHGGVLIELALDADTAQTIAEQLEGAGVELTLEIPEAVALASGHLMEFVSLLTTGRRLKAVLSDQAHQLLSAPDPTAAEVARLVCSAHVLGVGIHADRLADLQGRGPNLTSALRRLQAEHIIVGGDGETWQGLHQRRSTLLTELLHESPPPTLTSTLASVVDQLPPVAIGWALRRTIEIYGEATEDWDLEESARAAVLRCTTARECAALLEGLERVDRTLTARAYLPVLERYRRSSEPILSWSLLVLAQKIAGINIGDGLSGLPGAAGNAIEDCARQLPAPTTAIASAAARDLGASAIADMSILAGPEDALRLLEVAGQYVSFADHEAMRISQGIPELAADAVLDATSRRLNSRLISAIRVAVDDDDTFVRAFGEAQDRLDRAAGAHPNTLSAGMAAPDRIELELLTPLDQSTTRNEVPFHWDLPSARSGSSDPINDAAVELATYVGEYCPEIEIIEVRTVVADRRPLTIGNHELGHKRFGKSARPSRNLVRLNVGTQAAIGRQVSAHSWTELARQRSRLAEELANLITEAPRRLTPNDNSRRRAQWATKLGEINDSLAQLPRPPIMAEFDTAGSSRVWDTERDEGPLVNQLRQATAALQLLTQQPPGEISPLAVASQLEQDGSFGQEIHDSDSLLLASEPEVYAKLDEWISRLRGVLLSVEFDRSIAANIKGSPGELESTVDRLIEQASLSQLENERRQLAELMASIPSISIHLVHDSKPFITSIAGHQWVVTVPPHTWGAVEEVAADAASREEPVVDVPVTVTCELDGRLLPIAARLSRIAGSGMLPLGPESVDTIAEALGLARVRGEYLELVTRVVHELAKASWLNARTVHRQQSWPITDEDARARLRVALELLAENRGSEANALEISLATLCQRVQDEIGGDTSSCFAAALAGAGLRSGVAFDDDLEALARAQLAALQLELAMHRPGS